MLVAMVMLALAAPNPRNLDPPRRAYQTCLKAFEAASLAAKMEAVAYSNAVKGACAGEAATLVKALTDFDVAMGSKRAAAVATATSDVADYVLTSEERFSATVSAGKAK
ncbi:MAG: hypothetical protein M3R03_07665 [Pseudomonadota bacterium]|nr:hypothetical protein [Pseudomonadota bacterium]